MLGALESEVEVEPEPPMLLCSRGRSFHLPPCLAKGRCRMVNWMMFDACGLERLGTNAASHSACSLPWNHAFTKLRGLIKDASLCACRGRVDSAVGHPHPDGTHMNPTRR